LPVNVTLNFCPPQSGHRPALKAVADAPTLGSAPSKEWCAMTEINIF
jgi:hypothetical protein